MALEQPGGVVSFPKREQGLTKFLDRGKCPDPQQVFLEGPDETLGAAITLRGTDKGRRALEAEEGKLPLEHVGHILAAMIVADGKATSNALGEDTVAVAHSLADRLQCLEAQNPESSSHTWQHGYPHTRHCDDRWR